MNNAPSKRERDLERQASRLKAADVDMNPMVDLAFLLLTFFMLTTTFSRAQIMELLLPNKAEEEREKTAVRESQALHLLLDGEQEVFWYRGAEPSGPLEEVRLSRSSFGKFMREEMPAGSETVLLVKPSSSSQYGLLVDVLDELHALNVPRYALTEPTPADRKALAHTEQRP